MSFDCYESEGQRLKSSRARQQAVPGIRKDSGAMYFGVTVRVPLDPGHGYSHATQMKD